MLNGVDSKASSCLHAASKDLSKGLEVVNSDLSIVSQSQVKLEHLRNKKNTALEVHIDSVTKENSKLQATQNC